MAPQFIDVVLEIEKLLVYGCFDSFNNNKLVNRIKICLAIVYSTYLMLATEIRK